MGFKKIKYYFSLVKFIHTIFALPFALYGFTLGLHTLQFAVDNWLVKLICVLFCMVFARNAAMGFNRYADWKIDKKNLRTASREIPKGIISPISALLFVVINSILFIVTTFFINSLCFYLSPLALIIILGYSYTKRFTYLCHFILGIGLSIAPTGAYIAVTGVLDLAPLLLSLAVLLWVTGFDIMYALNDEQFDKNNNLFSIPSQFGIKKALLFSSILHGISAVSLVCLGLLIGGGLFFWIGVCIFSALLLYQHLIVKSTDLSRLNAAFQNVNGIASISFAIFSILDLVIK